MNSSSVVLTLRGLMSEVDDYKSDYEKLLNIVNGSDSEDEIEYIETENSKESIVFKVLPSFLDKIDNDDHDIVNNPNVIIEQKNENKQKSKKILRCWWCTLNILETPINITTITNEKIGYFCSYPCAKAYNDNNLCNQTGNYMIMRNNYFKKYGKWVDIHESPSKEVLEIYGGDVSEEEYREKLKELIV